MSKVITHLLAFLGGGGLVSFFLTRHFVRRDKHEELRVAAYRDVFASVAALRAVMERLESGFDYNRQPQPEDFTPYNELQTKTADLIEHHRADTGHVFADAAKAVLHFWDLSTDHMWEGIYDAPPILPALQARESALYDAVPESYRKRVAPGHFEGMRSRVDPSTAAPGLKVLDEPREIADAQVNVVRRDRVR